MAVKKVNPPLIMVKNLTFLLIFIVAVSFSGCSTGIDSTAAANRHYESFYNSMRHAAEKTDWFNDDREDQILRNIYDQMLKGDQTNTLLKIEIEESKKRTEEICAFLDKQSNTLKPFAEYDQVTGELMKPDETAQTGKYMLGDTPEANGGRGNGAAFEIRSKVNAYAEETNLQIAKICKKRGITNDYEQRMPARDPEFQNQTWEYAMFKGASAAEALAEIARLKMEVRLIQGAVLDMFQELTQGNWATEVNLVVLESVDTRVVDAGSNFVAEFRLGEVFRANKPVYETDGQVESGEDGNVIVRWKAKPSLQVNKEGLGVQPYRVIVKVPTADGGSRNVTHEGTYFVRQ